MIRLSLLILSLLPTILYAADLPPMHLSAFGAGDGPAHADGTYRLLDGKDTFGQSNAVAFDRAREGAFEEMTLRCRLRVLEGGDGGAFIFLDTAGYGRRGPAPFVGNWTEPNLAGNFAVGIDVHDPPTDDTAGSRGNYQGMPEREVSLHWDGREIVKRVAPAEFRGEFSDCEIVVRHVTGGAEITVRLAGEAVYDGYFLPGMLPYESRLAIGAGTREDAATEFDVRDLEFAAARAAAPRRRPTHFTIFNHVTVDATASPREEVALPPSGWAYGRVILTLEIHDSGRSWDGWDRAGHLYVVDPEGVRRDIAPFITSFRTPFRLQLDVTHFRPWLAGDTNFELAVSADPEGEKGFMMSASLDFHHGTPELEPYRVVPLWHGVARHGPAGKPFGDFFAPRAVEIDADARAARLFVTATGHTPVGEFTPSRRTLVFSPVQGGDSAGERRFDNLLWKTDCYLNPTRPQAGTWMYARAGWAPGDVVRPWRIDLTPHIRPGRTAELRYEPHPYDFRSVPDGERPTDEEIDRVRQIVRAYLVLYRPPADPVTAPHLEILQVMEESNAAGADLRAGDWIVSYDGASPATIEEIRAAIREAQEAGRESIPVVIYRGSERLEKQIGPGLMGVLLAEQ